MKQVLYFIGLKVVEVVGVAVGVFVLYWIGYLVNHIIWHDGQKGPILIIAGILSLLAVAIVISLGYELIKANWKKAGELSNKS